MKRLPGRAACLTLALVATPVSGQDTLQVPVSNSAWTEEMVPLDPFAAPAPFGPGEHLVYRVKIGIFNVGYGHMSVLGTEDVRDNPSYRVEMGIQGGLGPLKVNDLYKSWFDVTTFQSWRYIRDVHQINYKALRHYEFHPDSMQWHRIDNGETGPLISALPLDEIAFIYYIRSLPLEVGKSYTINRYFKEEGNPVVVEVLRRDQTEVDGKIYNTIVVNPLIQTSGLFSEGGDAELHFTDDDRRLLVYLKSNIPSFPGALSLYLESVQEGFPLHPESRKVALGGRQARSQEGASDR